jgi:hypothetical protein
MAEAATFVPTKPSYGWKERPAMAASAVRFADSAISQKYCVA